MRFLPLGATLAVCAAALTGCASTSGTSSAIGTSSKAGWGPHGKPLYYFMVLSNATPGQDEEYNRWYDRIHAPTVIDGGDFVWAQRFELSPDQFAGNGTPALKTRQYMVIFAVESNDVKATLAEVNKRLALPRNVASKALDYGSLQAVSWKALGPPTTRKDATRLLAEETAAGRIPKPGDPAPSGSERRFPGTGTGAGGLPAGAGGPPPSAAPPAAQ
jgi:hypothetical protein